MESASLLFERFKLFPSDDFISAYDLPSVLSGLGISQKSSRQMCDEIEQRGLDEITWPLLQAQLLSHSSSL
jgi:hypothetical protein